MLQVNIKNTGNQPLPQYQTQQSAGMDIHANVETALTLQPGQRHLIPTGLYIELPLGFEAQIRPRSGLALKHGITVLNSPGTIDADYRGEIKVLLINHGSEPFIINSGDRIAQLIVSKHEHVVFQLVEDLEDTARGAGGYGSSGK